MEEQTTITPVAEVQATPEPTVEKTIGEVLETKVETPVEAKPANTVPEHVFLAEKKARKDMERKLKDLEAKIGDGATAKETSSTLKAIAEEYDIDPNFLDKLANTIRSESKNDLQDEISSKFKPLEDEKRQDKINSQFDTYYNAAITSMPEFANIANAGVIKTLSLLPQNANKTFPQLIEETYGNALIGKRTIQSTTAGGGKDPASLDYAKATQDISYYNEVMANPKLKAEYNQKMLSKGF